MSALPRPLCEEIAAEEYRLLELLGELQGGPRIAVQEVLVALERLRRRAADLETANALRADLLSRQRALGWLSRPSHVINDPLEPLGH